MNFNSKLRTGLLLLVMGAFGIVLPAASALSIDNHLPQGLKLSSSNTTHHNRSPKQEPPVTEGFDRYKASQFSIQYPPTWQVIAEEEDRVAIVSPDGNSSMPMQTEIQLLQEDPNTVVPAMLDQLSAEGVSVQRYSLVEIDNQSGFRIWYSSADSQHNLVTFIGYGEQQTAILTSRYDANTDGTQQLIMAMHDSFENHSVAQANVPSPQTP